MHKSELIKLVKALLKCSFRKTTEFLQFYSEFGTGKFYCDVLSLLYLACVSQGCCCLFYICHMTLNLEDGCSFFFFSCLLRTRKIRVSWIWEHHHSQQIQPFFLNTRASIIHSNEHICAYAKAITRNKTINAWFFLYIIGFICICFWSRH